MGERGGLDTENVKTSAYSPEWGGDRSFFVEIDGAYVMVKPTTGDLQKVVSEDGEEV